MRTSEINVLWVKDICAEGIHVGNSWCKYMGLKSCKNGEVRDIPIPISKELKDELLIHAQLNPLYNGETSFIFFGLELRKSSCPKQWNKYLKRALKKAGDLNPEEITFYSWRHFFISRMLDVIQDNRIVMVLSRHKTTAMLDHYGKTLEQKKTLTIAKKAFAEVFKDEQFDNPESRALSKLTTNM
nr:site-specific integrase [Treponema pectinovorum]